MDAAAWKLAISSSRLCRPSRLARAGLWIALARLISDGEPRGPIASVVYLQ